MERIKKWLKAEFINGQTTFDWVFLVFGLLLQVFAIVYGYVSGTPDNVASIISALTGVVSVVLCAQGKISFYLFGYIQLFTYVFGVALPNHLYGEIGENIFYVITMIIGMVIWAKNYKKVENDTDKVEIKAKELTPKNNLIMWGIMIVGIIILAIILNNTNDPVPFFDAVTTIPAFVAQILLMLGYREQWVGWIIEDISSVIMFVIIGNWVMVAQYVFWTINCVYGWIKWSKSANAYK